MIVVKCEESALTMLENWKRLALEPFAEYLIRELDVVIRGEQCLRFERFLDFLLDLFEGVELRLLISEQEGGHVTFSCLERIGFEDFQIKCVHL